MLTKTLLHHVTTYYLESSHFNGMPARSLADRMSMEFEDLVPYLKRMIESGTISVVYGDKHPNPYVRALQDESSNDQIAKLIPEKLEHACIYPQPKHLESVVNKQQFFHLPYTLKLALGTPLYTHDFFDPSVLVYYERQPHCSIINDIRGVISLPYTKVRYSKALYVTDKGQPLTELIALNLEQLSSLRAIDQQYWYSMSLPVRCRLHPDIVHPLLHGAFRERISIFEALHEEMMAINGLCPLLDKPAMFEKGPLDIQNETLGGYLIRPTLRSFESFFMALQIQLFQHVNEEFLTSISTAPVKRRRGKRSTHIRRPSLTPLERIESWLLHSFGVPHRHLIRRFTLLVKKTRLETHRRLQRENTEALDSELLILQRRLMWNAYQSIKWIRTSLEAGLNNVHEDLHPLAREQKIWVQ